VRSKPRELQEHEDESPPIPIHQVDCLESP
jgi:hypothetical protein